MDKRRVNVRAIVVRGDKILAVKHQRRDGSETEYWAIPGGGLDPLETLQEGVKREVMEELGVEAAVGKLLFIQQFMTSREGFDEELEFHFLVEDSDAYDSIDLGKTTHGSHELSRVEFVDPREVTILPKFLSELDIATYATTEQPTYIYNELRK